MDRIGPRVSDGGLRGDHGLVAFVTDVCVIAKAERVLVGVSHSVEGLGLEPIRRRGRLAAGRAEDVGAEARAVLPEGGGDVAELV